MFEVLDGSAVLYLWCCLLCLLCARLQPHTYLHAVQLFIFTTGGTRTCIHTPGEPLDPAELALPCSRIRNVLDGAALVYFDGRLAEAALLLAGAELGVRVLILGLGVLLPHARHSGRRRAVLL